MIRNLLGAVWLLRCALCVVQAARTMQTKPRDSFIQIGSPLKLATWNCGGLSYTQRELCRELNYDLLALTETHDKGSLQSKNDFIRGDQAPAGDSYSGVALLLSSRLSKCVLHDGSNGSRVVFARIRADPCNLFIIGVYMPHSQRKQPPYFSDTMERLEEVLQQVRNNDCVIIMGDLNCKLARNIPKRTGRWCIHKYSNKPGEEMLDLMNRKDLCAISTMFKPPRGKTNATFVPRDPTFNETQIDYILISSRWATAITDSKVRWGASINRWGRKYDHGLVNCLFTSRLRSVKRPHQLDYTALKDEETRNRYEDSVKAAFNEKVCDKDDVSLSFQNLQNAVKKASKATLPIRKTMSLRKRCVSALTKQLYVDRVNRYEKLSSLERKSAARAVRESCRNDYRDYISGIVEDMEAADRAGNSRAVSKLVKILANKRSSSIMPTKDHSGNPITSSEQLLLAWNTFLEKKFAAPACDEGKSREATVSPEDHLTDEELDKALSAMKPGKAPGWDQVPVELYQNSETARAELYRILRLIWDNEDIPAEMVKGIFIMFYKKKDRNCFANYRAICLLCHAYKLLSAVISRRMYLELEEILPDSQAGFRPARGTRDNVCILKWTIKMVLREAREAVITFIDYAAAFDTESHLFLDEALSSAGVSIKVRRMIQSIYKVAHGCVRISKADGTLEYSDVFDICRGVLQGDIFSPVAFIVGLWRIFKLHDRPNSGITLGTEPYTVHVSDLAYADDAGLVDQDVPNSSERLSGISSGSANDAAMSISLEKTKAMHIHKRNNVAATTEAEIVEMKFNHKCSKCDRTFPTLRGLRVHEGRWCGRKKNRSRAGSLADKAVQRTKRKVEEEKRPQVVVNGEAIDNVYTFEYLGSQQQSDGEDDIDVKHRMDIAQATFASLSHIWPDHRLPLALRLRLYSAAICSTFSHACEAWDLTDAVIKKINGFNSRCLHVITGKSYRETAINPAFNLVRAVRQRRLRYLGHILRLPPERLLRKALYAYLMGSGSVPEGSLISDCPRNHTMEDLAVMAADRKWWEDMVNNIQ